MVGFFFIILLSSFCSGNAFLHLSGNGNCSCGTCECSKGWSGDTCDCTADIHGCLDSNKVKH